MSNFILYLFESGISLGLFYTVYWVFLKKETFFTLNRFFLVFSILFSFMVPFIHISSPFTARQLIENTYDLNQATGAQIQSLGISDILLLVYIFGAGLFLLRFFYQLLKFFKIIKKKRIQKYNGLNVVFIEEDLAPFSFFNFVFLSKSNISDSDFRRIIAHEMIHMKQYHSIDLIVLELLAIFQWFNPFVWPYKKSLKETHEYLADNAVIAQGCDTAKYQLLIFEQHVGVKLFEFANNFNHSQIKRRITMMTKRKSKKWAKSKVLLILPLFFFLMLAFADTKTMKEPYQGEKSDVDRVVVTQEDSESSVQAEDKEKKKKEAIKKDREKIADEKEKEDVARKEKKLKKEELVEKEKKLKEMLEKTDDPEKREKIKMKLLDLQKMKGTELSEKETLSLKKKQLKKLIAETDNPEKKKELKKYLEDIQKKENMLKKKEAEKKKVAEKEKEEKK